MSYFSDFKKNFKGIHIFRKRSDEVIGIDIGTQAIKVIQLKKGKEKPRLTKYGSIALGPYAGGEVGRVTKLPIQKLVEAIKILFTEAGITSRTGLMSISSKASLLVLLSLPKIDEKKLDQVVPIEARKYIPVPPEDVTINWNVISIDEKKSKMNILVAAIHNRVLSDYQKIAQEIGMESVQFEIETFSMIRSVSEDEKASECISIIDIGSDSSKIVIVATGIVYVSHTINMGAQSMTEAIMTSQNHSFSDAEQVKRGVSKSENKIDVAKITSSNAEHIFNEAGGVMANFEQKEKKQIKKVYLVGGGALTSGVLKMAENILKKTIKMGNPFNKVEAPTAILKPILDEAGPEFAVSVGLALRALSDD